MAWYEQATSHYQSQCWHTFLSVSPYSLTKSQWVKFTDEHEVKAHIGEYLSQGRVPLILNTLRHMRHTAHVSTHWDPNEAHDILQKPYWWWIDIYSDIDLVPLGNKPLSELGMTQISVPPHKFNESQWVKFTNEPEVKAHIGKVPLILNTVGPMMHIIHIQHTEALWGI